MKKTHTALPTKDCSLFIDEDEEETNGDYFKAEPLPHGKKSVSFFTNMDNNASSIFSAADCLQYMKRGTSFVKLRTSGRQYKRNFYLDEQMHSIRWVSTSKRHARAQIHITEIHDVRLGCSARSTHSLTRRHKISQSPNVACGATSSTIRQHSGSFRHSSQPRVPHGYNTLPSSVDLLATNKSSSRLDIASSSFTISYGPDFDTVELLASSPEEANIWITGLKCLMSGVQDPRTLEERQKPRDIWLQRVFAEADLNRSGYLTEHQVLRVMQSINPALSETHVHQQWKEWDHHCKERKGRIDRANFVNFFKTVSTRQEIYHLLVRYASGSELLTCDDLRNFLASDQARVGITLEQCQKIIDTFEPSAENRQLGLMGIDGFTSFLLSRECDLFDSKHLQVCQDMSQPITHYYVAASHKTFLLEDQLTGPCSIEGYRRALLSGCRYIEIELYDGHDGYPVVRRANSRPPGLPVRAVLEAINVLAFQRSDYPLIISIESYNSVPQQVTLAKLLVACFGPRLLLPSTEFSFTLGDSQLESEAQVEHRFDSSRKNNLTTVNLRNENSLYSGSGSQIRWPSPRDLIGRILLKGKRLPKGVTQVTNSSGRDIQSVGGDHFRRFPNYFVSMQCSAIAKELSDLYFFDSTDVISFPIHGLWKGDTSTPLNFPGPSISSTLPGKALATTGFATGSSLFVVGTHVDSVLNQRRHSKSSLSDCTVSGPGSDRSRMHPYHILQLSEAEASKAFGYCAGELVKVTRNSLIEVIPSPSRADSSNLNPVDIWAWGGQVVPLNYQTAGLVMDLATGFFARNGACGYVLKPTLYRCVSSFFTPTVQLHNTRATNHKPPDTTPQNFRLKIISAQQLPKPRGSVAKGDTIEPFVVVELHGIPVDCAEHRTATAAAGSANCYNAIFNETIEFCVQLGSLALVRFLVLDDHAIGDDFIGQNTIPFDCMLPGYRHVRLRSDTGEPIPQATLFVHVTITNRGEENQVASAGVLQRFRTKKRQHPQLKRIGNPTLDDVFKAARSTLNQAADLRNAITIAFEQFRQACGETSASTSMAQCVRSLATRLHTACGSPDLWPVRMRVRPEDDLPHLELQSTSPFVGSNLSVFPSLSTLGDTSLRNTHASRFSPAPSMRRSPSVIMSSRSIFQRKLKRAARSMDEDARSTLSIDTTSLSQVAVQSIDSTGDTSPVIPTRLRRLSSQSITSSMSSLSIGGADKMKRAVTAFETFIESGKTLIKQGPYLRVKLEHAQKSGLEAYSNFLEALKDPSTQVTNIPTTNQLAEIKPSTFEFSSLQRHTSHRADKPIASRSPDRRSSTGGSSLYWRKMSRIADAVTWNLRLLTGQTEKLTLTLSELSTWLRQARESGQATGLMTTQSPSQEMDELADRLDANSLLSERSEEEQRHVSTQEQSGPHLSDAGQNDDAANVGDATNTQSTTLDVSSKSKVERNTSKLTTRERKAYFPNRFRTSLSTNKPD